VSTPGADEDDLYEDTLPAPPLRAVACRLEEAAPFPGFARYMERCLYDPAFGYYGAGKVAFGRSRHYWTYPQRLRPLFGWMVAEVARCVFEALARTGAGGEGVPLTILELGAGEGELARDTLDYILDRAHLRAWSPFAGRIRYVIAEPSEPLRKRQRVRLRHYLASGRAAIMPMDAGAITWHDPFTGLIVANELIDSFPCERLRIAGTGPAVHRVHAVPILPAGNAEALGVTAGELLAVPEGLRAQLAENERALAESAFWRLIEKNAWDPDETGCRLAELEVPIDIGWQGTDARDPSPPQQLMDYVTALKPLVDDLAASGLLPVDLHWSPRLRTFIEGVSSLLSGSPQHGGAALLLDYGGTSRHVIDPRSAASHLRIYGGLRMYDHQPLPYLKPGSHDMTWDVDFTEVARLAEQAGLRVAFFGHQRAIETPPVDLDAPPAREHLAHSRLAEGTDDAAEAVQEAEELVEAFREAAGFRCLILTGPETPYEPAPLGASDPVAGRGLYSLRTGVTPEQVGAALAEAGLHPGIAAFLKPCGDVIADLCDRRLYPFRHRVLEVLESRGWLAAPGELRVQRP
jgi:SAM-dependent MidA family methyltransferase